MLTTMNVTDRYKEKRKATGTGKVPHHKRNMFSVLKIGQNISYYELF